MLLSFSCMAQLKPVYNFQQDDTTLKRKYYNEALQKKSLLLASNKGENSKDYKAAYDNMFGTVEDLLISTRSVTEHTADNYIKSIAAKIINARSAVSVPIASSGCVSR